MAVCRSKRKALALPDMTVSIAASLILVILALLATAIVFQRRFFYYPRKYSPSEIKAGEEQGALPLSFKTSQENQTAFAWRIAPSSPPPERLWILFGGNAMNALEWLEILDKFPSDSTGFLLVDYPGYGLCSGQATLDSIAESSVGAYRALVEQNQWTTSPQFLGAMGWSLGAAAALQFATKQPVQHLILMSPFTTMEEMVKKFIGFRPRLLLLDRFDNLATLAQICARKPVPKITIVHGEKDALIPVDMGRTLAALAPHQIDYRSVPGASHHSVFSAARPFIYSRL